MGRWALRRRLARGGVIAGLRMQLLKPIQSLRVPLRPALRLQTSTFHAAGCFFT
jgi:hypothetical protein